MQKNCSVHVRLQALLGKCQCMLHKIMVPRRYEDSEENFQLKLDAAFPTKFFLFLLREHISSFLSKSIKKCIYIKKFSCVNLAKGKSLFNI